MAVKSIAYAKIVVGDLDRLQSFYSEFLGLTLAMRIEEGEGDDAFAECFFAPGPQSPPQIVLIAYTNRPAPPRGEAVLALRVDSVDEIVASTCRGGGAIAVEAYDVPEHNIRMAYVTDPEGHLIELIQMSN